MTFLHKHCWLILIIICLAHLCFLNIRPESLQNSDELFHFQESKIQPLTPEELFSEITAEIEFYQSQIAILQQKLAAVTGGSTNG
ncbi:MAG: hypothetical protein ACYTXI_40510 [Nostoc sp.]